MERKNTCSDSTSSKKISTRDMLVLAVSGLKMLAGPSHTFGR